MYIFVKIFFSLAWTTVDADVLKLLSSVSSAAAMTVGMILKNYDFKHNSDSDDYIYDYSDLYKQL